MTKLEEDCGSAVQNQYRPLLELAIREELGTRPGNSDWLTYQIDPISHSPSLLFHYPLCVSGGLTYIATSVKKIGRAHV